MSQLKIYPKKVRFKSSFKRSKALNVDLRKTVPKFRSRRLKYAGSQLQVGTALAGTNYI